MLIPQNIIRAKRDGQVLTDKEIQDFVAGITSGEVSEAQIAALAMATFLNGMDVPERTALTLAMRDSGTVMSWDLPGPVVDKHSTGGVGDMTSLMLGPIVAACGGYIPMITGRGLGHTGGTLDKLDSIPGYQAQPSNDLFRRSVKELGVCIIGQTDQLAPADKKFYATRDITATVESIPLITASILSKKLAEGLDGLVMDVKVGRGAFMKDMQQAEQLAQSIVQVANAAGVRTSALLTNMDFPLAWSAGNSVEIYETMNYLTGKSRHSGLHEVTIELAAEMLINVKLASSRDDALNQVNIALDSGKAAEIFAKMVSLLGGPTDLLENPDLYLPQASIIRPVLAKSSGYIQSFDTWKLGMGVVALGGGRLRSSDKINHSVGFSNIPERGCHVNSGDPLITIHAESEEKYRDVEAQLHKWIQLTDQPIQSESLILKQINEDN